MILQCPKCKQKIDISEMSELKFSCPTCGEEVDLGKLPELTCPICGAEFEPEDTIVVCPDCKTVYHSDCWDENHGCSTYGCASAQHLETHNAANAESDNGMAACPFCGAQHAKTDLVCPSCGHLLAEGGGSNSDDMLESVKKGAAYCAPRLGRNFKLLFADLKSVLALTWKAMSHYFDFKSKASRAEYFSFMIPLYVITELLLLFQADVLVHRVIYPVCVVPIISITVRRLRDTGLSPWMIFAIPILPLLVFVPSVDESADKEN